MAELAPRKTPVTAEQLYDALGDDLPRATRLILVAQSALETGRWASLVCYNLGNVKCPQPNVYDHCYFSTQEYVPRQQAGAAMVASTSDAPVEVARDEGGTHVWIRLRPKHPGCCFRAFSTLEQAAAWFVNFLKSHYSLAWSSALAGDPPSFVHNLRQGGYFTAPEDVYSRRVVQLYHEFDQLIPHATDNPYV